MVAKDRFSLPSRQDLDNKITQKAIRIHIRPLFLVFFGTQQIAKEKIGKS